MKKFSVITVIILVSMIIFYSVNMATSADEPDYSIKNPIVTVTLDNKKVLKIELYPKDAPNTVNNFIDLSGKAFFNNMPFTKVIPNYLLQTGDPIGDGTGFPGYFIKSECKQNGFKNKLKCEAGTLCMARARKYNTEGSQFFILLNDDLSLNGQYTAFGKVVEGLEILQEIGKTPIDNDKVIDSLPKIKNVTVETFGIKYNEPQVISIYEERNKDL